MPNNVKLITMKDGKPMPIIGVDWFNWAELDDEPVTGIPTYKETHRLPGMTNVALARNATTASFFGDNGVYASAAQTGETNLTLTTASVPANVMTAWQGLEGSGGGAYVDEINPIEMAVFYRIKKANNHYRYRIFFKAKATMPDESAATQGGTITYQTETITFAMAKLVCSEFNHSEYFFDTDDAEFPDGMTNETVMKNLTQNPMWRPGDGDQTGTAEPGGGAGDGGDGDGLPEA